VYRYVQMYFVQEHHVVLGTGAPVLVTGVFDLDK